MRKRTISFLLLLCLSLALLSSCEETVKKNEGKNDHESGVTWDPSESEMTDPEPEETAYVPEPGDFTVGKLKNELFYQGLFGDYALAAGVKINVKEYESEKELIEAARKGEFDLLTGSEVNLIKEILACEGSLRDLGPMLEKHIGTGEYYDNILEIGRINGRLQIAISHARPFNTIMTPKGAVDAFGGAPSDIKELNEFYDTLEADFRTLGLNYFDFDLLIDAGLDIPGTKIDLTPYYGEWVAFLQKRMKDIPENPTKMQEEVLHLFDYGRLEFPSLGLFENWFSYEGKAYTRFGAEAAMIPFPLKENAGFFLDTASDAVPLNAANGEAAMAYIDWLLSEEGQKVILDKSQEGNDGTQYPIAPPVRIEYAHRWFDTTSYGDDAEGEERERMKAENREMVDAIFSRIDRLPVLRGLFAYNVDAIIRLRAAKREDREHELREFVDEKRDRVLKKWLEEMTNEESLPRFYEEGTFDDWPAFIEGFIADYLADLGYEVTKTGYLDSCSCTNRR